MSSSSFTAKKTASTSIAITLAMLIFPVSLAIAGAHLDEVAPNGWSPWWHLETWQVTQGYGSGLHTDQYNDYYAIDFVPTSGTSNCDRSVYPIYNNMRVNYVDKITYGRIDLTTTISGVEYKIKYLHLNSITVQQGAIVGSDNIIGTTGNKGTGICHLHINVQKKVGSTWYGIKPKFCQTTYSKVGQLWPGC